MDDEDGKTRGRNERLRGQIGVSTSALRDGWTMGPPAESEYAVEPVGVDTMRPSDYTISQRCKLPMRTVTARTTASVRCCPSTKISIVLRCALDPLCSAISFMTCQSTLVTIA